MKNWFFLIFFIVFLVFDSYSQCSMCKAVVESNLENGDKIGTGLNDGILYLMAMPYLALALISFFWYRYHKSNH